jgi:hypothetical protein
VEDTETDESGREISVLYSSRRETTYRVVTALPGDAHAAEIQAELAQLLFGGKA